jgi:hypothetical protein
MKDHGFDPKTATADKFIEICERAETKDSVQLKGSSKCSSDENSDDDERRSKKTKKKA